MSIDIFRDSQKETMLCVYSRLQRRMRKSGGGSSAVAIARLFPVTLLQHCHCIMTSAQEISSILTNLEETFYQSGMVSGRPHGELHGTFEGRALGKQKAWEVWEEVGYYEGTARLWKIVLLAQGKKDSRYEMLACL